MYLEGFAQGSYYAITYFDEQGRDFQKGVDSIFHAIDMSVNLWVDTSIICKVNRNEDVILDNIFIDNFNIAQQAAELSGGYFDPTISPLVSAWGFSAENGELRTENGELIDSLDQQAADKKSKGINLGKNKKKILTKLSK